MSTTPPLSVDNDDATTSKQDELGALPSLSDLTRQTTDVTHTDHDHHHDHDNLGTNTLNMASLPDLSAITRQQTDIQHDHDEEENGNENIQNELDMGKLSDLSLSSLARQQTDVAMNEEAQGLLSLPELNNISRQITDVTHNEQKEEHEMMMNQTDNDPALPLNQYLDPNLVMFDNKGKLLDIDNEQFITLTKDDDDDGVGTNDLEDNSLNQFIEHTEPIICLAFNPKKDYQVISGGQDEKCYIWDAVSYDATACDNGDDDNNNDNDEEKKPSDKDKGYITMNNHKDTIIDCSWNSSGKYVATASMDNTIKIFNCHKNMKLISSLDIGNELSFIEWHPNVENEKKYKNILMAGSLDKNIWIYQYSKQSKTFIETQILSGHSGEIECGGFTKYNNGRYGYSGDKDGMIIIWESIIDCDPYSGVKKFTFKPSTFSGLYHESGINCIDDCNNAPLLISGSCDHSVCLINFETGKILNKLGKHKDSVECVKFNNLYKQEIKYTNFASSSSLDGCIKIWDLNTGQIRHELQHDDGVIVHEWFNTEQNSNLLLSGCMNGILYIWDVRSAKLIKELKGHSKCSIQAIKISHDDNYIVSGSDDSIVRVWTL